MTHEWHTAREYYADVQQRAESAADRLASVNFNPDTAVSETLDNDYWLIHADASFNLLQVSDNCDAFAEMGITSRHFTDALQQMAAAAMEADVRAELLNLRPEYKLGRERLKACLDATTVVDTTRNAPVDSLAIRLVVASEALDGEATGDAYEITAWPKRELHSIRDADPDAFDALAEQCRENPERLENL